MLLLVLIPLALQSVVILFDEFYFHIKRGLPKWERIGHPIDTLSVISCLLFVMMVPYNLKALFAYAALALFSCFLVTKDEVVHKDVCPKRELWLHALLFVLHPLMLLSFALIWMGSEYNFFTSFQYKALCSILKLELSFILLFFTYQIVYWNWIWQEKK